jgi:hypothetical protein
MIQRPGKAAAISSLRRRIERRSKYRFGPSAGKALERKASRAGSTDAQFVQRLEGAVGRPVVEDVNVVSVVEQLRDDLRRDIQVVVGRDDRERAEAGHGGILVRAGAAANARRSRIKRAPQAEAGGAQSWEETPKAGSSSPKAAAVTDRSVTATP